MTKWEYDEIPVEKHPYTKTIKELNDLGDKGWELILFKDVVRPDGKITGLFKRVKP